MTAWHRTFSSMVPLGVRRFMVLSPKRKRRAGILVNREPHIRAALIVMDDVGWDIVDCAVGWVLLFCKDAAYDSDGVADGAAYVEA